MHQSLRAALFLALIACVSLLCEKSIAVTEQQWNTLKNNVREMELAPTKLGASHGEKIIQTFGIDAAPIVNEASLEKINERIRNNGTFKGVDYNDKGRSLWKTLDHLDHCRVLAIGLNTFPEAVLSKHKVRENCLSALDWWLKNNPSNPNWWNNEVYVCQMLGNIAVLLSEKDLTTERREALTRIMKQAKPSRTGQNRLWLSWNSLLGSFIRKDGPRAEEALKAMSDTITIASPGKEGIQPDMSFHQHGPQLYQGNYGRHFIHSATKFIRAVEGTRWEDGKNTELVVKFILDGTRWMCSGNLLDYNVWGRQITYDDRIQGPDLFFACQNLAKIKTPRSEELFTFNISLLEPGTSRFAREKIPFGTRAFPYSDYIVHHGMHQYMTGVKMSSKRTITGESTNGDNLLGCYLSDGCVLTYVSGREYDMIFPVWDWTCIPGTTTERHLLPPSQKWDGKRGSSDFAGALDEGVAGMICRRFGLSARKSWFFFHDRIVCLGSGISKDDTASPVLTTVEQSLLRQDRPMVTIEGEKVKSLSHADILYLFPKNTSLVLETGKRTGNWRNIRSASEDKPAEREVFLLAVDHGYSPREAAYIYQVMPKGVKASREKTSDALWEEITILGHDSVVHAIARGKEMRFVFFEAGECKLPGGSRISVQEPCLLSLSGKRKWSAMIPGPREGVITIKVNGRAQKILLSSFTR